MFGISNRVSTNHGTISTAFLLEKNKTNLGVDYKKNAGFDFSLHELLLGFI